MDNAAALPAGEYDWSTGEALYWNLRGDDLDAPGVTGRAGPLGREDLYWNVSRDEREA